MGPAAEGLSQIVGQHPDVGPRRALHLEIDLVQGHNAALVDLFDRSHARKVLAEFARLAEPARPAAEQLAEPLSEREKEILRLMAQGANNRQIASQLFLAEGTVKNYVSTILDKLSVQDRTQAALRARELGLL